MSTLHDQSPAETIKQITHLAAALKAPRITESAARLADHARDAGWTHEDYLAAVLEREVAARNASGAQLRIRAAGMPAVKTIEDFDFDQQPTARTPIQALASGDLPGRAPQRRPPRPTRNRLTLRTPFMRVDQTVQSDRWKR